MLVLRRLAAAVIALAIAVSPKIAVARSSSAHEYKVGIAHRTIVPAGNYPWRGSKDHALRTILWYPAQPDVRELVIGIPPAAPLWLAGQAAKDAPLLPSEQRFPLIVLSHGTGGSAMQLGWLGTALARRGFVAVAVDHPGNNSNGEYTPEGFVLWWERARDLRQVINGTLADSVFGPVVDHRRIGAAGFSLGGHTVMEIAGGRTDLDAFERYCTDHPQAYAGGPPEFPNLSQRFKARLRADPRIRASMRLAGESYRDERVKAVFAIAPALGQSFTPAGLASITIPIRIVVGEADLLAPSEPNAAYYASHVPGARLDLLPKVGHYTFLGLPTAKGKQERPLYSMDPPGVERAAVHEQVSSLAAEFFEESMR